MALRIFFTLNSSSHLLNADSAAQCQFDSSFGTWSTYRGSGYGGSCALLWPGLLLTWQSSKDQYTDASCGQPGIEWQEGSGEWKSIQSTFKGAREHPHLRFRVPFDEVVANDSCVPAQQEFILRPFESSLAPNLPELRKSPQPNFILCFLENFSPAPSHSH